MADKPIRVLVIDDEDIVLVSIKKNLSRLGYDVDTVQSAESALERIEKKVYHLVITDLKMPKMDGIDLLQEFSKRSCFLPTIMITGYPTIGTAVQALKLGAVDYILKPFTRQELLGPVYRALKRGPISLGTQEETELFAHLRSEYTDPLLPGDTFYLPGHSWARFEQDGTLLTGAEDVFLKSLGEVREIFLPSVDDLVEQGFAAVKFVTATGETHELFSPISGRVVNVNHDAVRNVAQVSSCTWLMSVVPSQLRKSLGLLGKRKTG